MAVPAMAWLWILRSGAQSPQRQQPARRQTHEFSWWKGGVTMRGCPSTGSGAPCCARPPAAVRATTPARRERGLSGTCGQDPGAVSPSRVRAEHITVAETKSPSLLAAGRSGGRGGGGVAAGRSHSHYVSARRRRGPLRASLLRSVSPLTQRCSPDHVSHRKWSVRGQLSLSVRTTTWFG